jgi:hypothetical protein
MINLILSRSKNISIIQNIKSPFNSPFFKGGYRGILISFYYAKIKTKKFIKNLGVKKE